MYSVEIKRYADITPDIREIFRYLGIKTPGETDYALLDKCLPKAKKAADGRICFTRFPVQSDGIKRIRTPFFQIESSHLAHHWEACSEAVLFAATIGMDFERLIKQASVDSPAKGVMLHAMGTAFAEEVCDIFNGEITAQALSENKKTVTRFSPGYGDLPLSLQKDIFDILNPPKHIGLYLNESLLMTPTKSVTAFIGIKT